MELCLKYSYLSRGLCIETKLKLTDFHSNILYLNTTFLCFGKFGHERSFSKSLGYCYKMVRRQKKLNNKWCTLRSNIGSYIIWRASSQYCFNTMLFKIFYMKNVTEMHFETDMANLKFEFSISGQFLHLLPRYRHLNFF